MKFLNKRPERLFRHLRYATFEAQFMKKLSNTEAELKKKHCFYKKACIRNTDNVNFAFSFARLIIDLAMSSGDRSGFR